MLRKRIIPCLDVDRGRVVKGVRFGDLAEMGDPAVLAAFYDREGADEICFLDISATLEGRKAMTGVIEAVAAVVSLPLSAGGGVADLEDLRSLLLAGADKVCINSAAVRNPGILESASGIFGSQCVVLAVDAASRGGRYEVFIDGGRTPTGLDPVTWVERAVSLGAGEILLTSIDRDGTRAGYDLDLLRSVTLAAGVPVIASGGAGGKEHFREALVEGGASAALAAGLFHGGDMRIGDLKAWLASACVNVRLEEEVERHEGWS
ncbi:imidazole glycerol phosphate synthase subunit HisF [Candidatus Fermentibacteria bacterium]|nr:imidazole glycerol phosphate synthase subunit HisF [Candidatus Fermentibacteria bacterium]